MIEFYQRGGVAQKLRDDLKVNSNGEQNTHLVLPRRLGSKLMSLSVQESENPAGATGGLVS